MFSQRHWISTLMTAALVLGPCGAKSAAAQTPDTTHPPIDLNDKGTFALSFAGHPLGTEHFSIRSSPNKIEAEGDIEIKSEQQGHVVNLKSTPKLVLNSQFEPQSYVVNQKGEPQFHLEVDFHSSPVKSRLRLSTAKDDDVRELGLTKDVVVLDDNVIHHYQLLVDRFYMKPDKQQTFNAYTPQEAVPGVVNIQEVGPQELDLGGKKETMRHLVVSTEMTQIDLWVDAQQHLRRVFFPAVQLEAIRTK